MATTYMNLNLPVPSQTAGPVWAESLNTAVATIDSHDHTAGKGTQVPASGLNINADLSIGSNTLTDVKSVNLTSETESLSPSNVQAVYSYAGDLWYNNSTGTAVQITQGSSVTTSSSPLVPAGVMWPFGGVSAPTGFLACDGSAVSRSGFQDLFDAIGTAYGAGDGSLDAFGQPATFNLPDMRGRTPIGAGVYTDPVSGAVTRSLGVALGAEKHLLTTTEMPSHNHIQNAHNHTLTDPGHTHAAYNSGSAFAGTFAFAESNILTTTSGASTTGISISAATATNQPAGGGAVHNNMQPSLVTNWIIKT